MVSLHWGLTVLEWAKSHTAVKCHLICREQIDRRLQCQQKQHCPPHVLAFDSAWCAHVRLMIMAKIGPINSQSTELSTSSLNPHVEVSILFVCSIVGWRTKWCVNPSAPRCCLSLLNMRESGQYYISQSYQTTWKLGKVTNGELLQKCFK